MHACCLWISKEGLSPRPLRQHKPRITIHWEGLPKTLQKQNKRPIGKYFREVRNSFVRVRERIKEAREDWDSTGRPKGSKCSWDFGLLESEPCTKHKQTDWPSTFVYEVKPGLHGILSHLYQGFRLTPLPVYLVPLTGTPCLVSDGENVPYFCTYLRSQTGFGRREDLFIFNKEEEVNRRRRCLCGERK